MNTGYTQRLLEGCYIRGRATRATRGTLTVPGASGRVLERGGEGVWPGVGHGINSSLAGFSWGRCLGLGGQSLRKNGVYIR